MKKLEKKILKLIKASGKTSWEDIAFQLNRTRASLKKARRMLYQEGYVANYYGGKVSVFYRSIDVYEKGYEKTLRENYHVHGIITSREEVLIEEIELPNQITISQLRKVIRYVEDDYYYHWTYRIDKSSAPLFERTNNVKFDFEKFDYILC
jgi:DNA-binding Lrp family transcriptional regulator